MAESASPCTPSSAHREDEQGDGSQPSKKRRTGGPRGVANLTADQLARKRANDREAQRAIRERTKNQIDALNRRIRELESQQPYHDLQLVLRDKEAVQAENADIRKRLEHVLGVLQPMVRASDGLNELAAAAARSPLPLPPRHPHAADANGHGHGHGHGHDHTPEPPRSFPPGLHDLAATPPQNGSHSGVHSHVHSPNTTEGGRPWLFPGDAPTSHLRRYSPPHLPPDAPFDERLGVDFLLDHGQRRVVDPDLPPPHQPPPSNVSTSQQAQYAPALVPHLTLPRNSPATCPLDTIMLDFLSDRQARAAEGHPIRTLVGPLYPHFTSLVYPDRNVESHPLSKLFTDILRTFPDICGVPEQVAIVFVMFLIMRWQIEPTQENYDRLPHWVTPRASQLFIAHPCWFDHLPWPKLRDKIIATQPFISFDTFFIPFTTSVSLNWPYEPRDCLLPASKVHPTALSSSSSVHASSPYSAHVNAPSPAGPPLPQSRVGTPGAPSLGVLPKEEEQWVINPAFESHLRDLNNWTLGPNFRNTFPMFAPCVKIKEGR
ncbi:hypothetical protein P153DRAFT_369199 [Dothidotthia symphoricarpi CBS 119687]|uniref:BZIP transcription factor n=1 Tax=Dothidotthia symphoricarpi CBS 119687 TaxID=1392245 RepID=A0A6A6A781_9PLEO|nr:uncharacterized protein P153DRAFT_369199 [Dothidotthia symphoricarpi CBS 119687]KAF2126491.1 hypothetical protein P153DRAFT_369199 [Dothidotthia symphoricarpi CBS 119687]